MTDDNPSADYEFFVRWRDSPLLTPRIAAGMAGVLRVWVDRYLDEWARGSRDEPSYEVVPLAVLDKRCLFDVGESRAWVASVADACEELAAALDAGINPLGVPHRPIDEILMFLAIEACARGWLEDGGDAVESIPRRPHAADDRVREDDWDSVWPRFEQHSTLLPGLIDVTSPGALGVPAALRAYPPRTWFDLTTEPVR